MAADGGKIADWFSKPGDSISAVMQRREVSAEGLAARLDGGIDEVRGLLDGTRPIDQRVSEVLSDAIGGSRVSPSVRNAPGNKTAAVPASAIEPTPAVDVNSR